MSPAKPLELTTEQMQAVVLAVLKGGVVNGRPAGLTEDELAYQARHVAEELRRCLISGAIADMAFEGKLALWWDTDAGDMKLWAADRPL